MADNILDRLGRAYEAWLEANGMADAGDAEELVLSGREMTDAQRVWLRRFIALWAATEDGQ